MGVYLFDLLGVTAAGRGFELLLWSLVGLVGALLAVREWRSGRRPADEWLTWIVAAGLVAFGLWRVANVAAGALYLGEAGLRLPTYGVAIATGFALSIVLSYRDAERSPASISGAQLVDLAFWTLLGGLAGARLVYVLTDPGPFVTGCFAPADGAAADCLAVFRFWEGGMVFWGGFVGGIGGGALWCWRAGASFLAAADVIVPYVPFGHAIGRLGCIGAGCCYGRECDLPLALRYPAGSLAWVDHFEHGDDAARLQLVNDGLSFPVHAVPLYEALGELAIFAFLVLWLRPRRRYAGELLLAWIALYGPLRFVLEFFRGDEARGYLAELSVEPLNRLLGLAPGTVTMLSTSQAFSLAVAAVAMGVWIWLRRRGAAPATRAQPRA